MNEEIKQKLLIHFKTKAEIARFLCVSRQQVNHWFNAGRLPSVRSSMKLAKELDINWTDIRYDLRDV